MAITGLSAQELVRIARSDMGTAGGRASAIVAAELIAATGTERRGNRPDTTAADLAQAVMGSDAWAAYKNSAYKQMKGPRRPQGRRATSKRVKERKLKLNGSLAGWTLQVEPEHFAGVDTGWTMDQTLTWLPPDGNVNHEHLETLGNMISEAFFQHKMKVLDATRSTKNKYTVAKASEWMTDTSVGADFFKPKK
mmetsp:Transcript_52027/g.76168  ORF Transcript_52027/g.76168 Transcript_52027/m.76168 type:complete len:194 (-) Transcript_52027:201-782(-)